MHYYKPLVTLALPGVEVVTVRAADGKLESILHGGRLDGERLASNGDDDAEAQHERALRLARIAGSGNYFGKSEKKPRPRY